MSNHLLSGYPLVAAPAFFTGDPTAKIINEPFINTDSYYDGGTTVVSGTVTYNGAPGARKVSLFTLIDKRLIAETWSDPVTGIYSFGRLKDQEYFVWSEDYMRVFAPETNLVPNT